MEKTVSNLIAKKNVSRRVFVGTSVAAGTAAILGCGSEYPDLGITSPAGYSDKDVLNLALNIEYLEAEFYLRAATGAGLAAADAGSGAGAVNGGRQVTFATAADASYAYELAQEELNHVRALRSLLGSDAVPRPSIDFTAGFATLGTAAGVASSPLDPFSDPNYFLVGAFTFEDTGVTAYRGGLALLSDPKNVAAAASVLTIEAYHAAEIRTRILQNSYSSGVSTYLTAANKISAFRASIGAGNETQIGPGSDGSATVSPNGLSVVDTTNSLGFIRSTDQILRLLYGGVTAKISSGLFFPQGLNGNIKAASA